jgi:hypothetical protein
VYVASQRLEELLELMATDGDTRPLVVTSRDRLDIVMGLLASQVGAAGLVSRLCSHMHICTLCMCEGRGAAEVGQHGAACEPGVVQ